MKKICFNIVDVDKALRQFIRSKRTVTLVIPKSIEVSTNKILSSLEESGHEIDNIVVSCTRRGLLL